MVQLLLLLILAVVAINAHADCTCRQPNQASNTAVASQGGDGASLCSVAETVDGSRCQIAMLGVSARGGYQQLAERLQRRARRGVPLPELLADAGLNYDPVAALLNTATVAPEQWSNVEFADNLSALLALNQSRRRGNNDDGFVALDKIHAFLRANTAELLARFSDGANVNGTSLTLAPYTLTLSYGCLELVTDDFIWLARTPFANANGGRCGG